MSVVVIVIEIERCVSIKIHCIYNTYDAVVDRKRKPNKRLRKGNTVSANQIYEYAIMTINKENNESTFFKTNLSVFVSQIDLLIDMSFCGSIKKELNSFGF